MSERVTKERILDAAEGIMLSRSFHSVGLNQILSAVNVPKGSFYHYFASKEQFGVEMLRHYAAEANAMRRQMLSNTEIQPNPILRLLAMFQVVIETMEESGGKCPCLMQKLAAEVSDFSDSMREELTKGFDEVIKIFKHALDEAVEKELLAKDFDTATEAAIILDIWAGAQQRALIYRKSDSLHTAKAVIKSRLTIPS